MRSREGQLSGRLSGGRPGSRRGIVPIVGILAILLVGSLGIGGLTGVASGVASSRITVGDISDNHVLNLVVGGVTHSLSDTTVTLTLSASLRSYEIELRSALPLPLDFVGLSTLPVTQWAGPGQVPGGPDYLPPLTDWSWIVLHGKQNSTENWTDDSSTGVLNTTVPWVNATFTVTGTPQLSVAIGVTPGAANGPIAPQAGLVVGTQVPYNDPDFTALARALDPGVLRWSQVYDAPATWNQASGSVSFNFTAFSALMNLSESVGAKVYLSLPAGSWGDGNSLPAGMPLNTSAWVNWWGHSSGYYPALSAYRTFLTTFVRDVTARGWNIAYWNIGNEVPVGFNKTVAAEFVTVFNAAATDIHSVLPHAVVGSDVFTWPTKTKYFAEAIQGAGFLSFHDYPATGLCANPATYCPPDNVKGYLTDSQIIANSNNYSDLPWSESPRAAQESWYNVTGQWLPIIDSETDLNSAQQNGFDPRGPTLFNAAWLVSQLIDGASQNLSSMLVYSFSELWPPGPSPTEQYGGWGQGILAQESSGSTIKFAPYWALDLWASAVPHGARELPLTDGDSSMVRAFAASSGSDVSVIVANRAGVDVTIPITSSNRSWVAVAATTLDETTYQLQFNATTQSAHLLASGMGHPSASEKSSMSLNLAGYGVGVVTFAPVAPTDHSVTFSENGLPSGSTWSATLNGATHASSTPSIAFNEPNGEYAYSIPAIAGYSASTRGGSVTVDGANVEESVTFTPLVIRYAVTFTETGLPTNAVWSVTVGSTPWNSSGDAIDLELRNGSYDYFISSGIGYRAQPSSGQLTVSGGDQNVTVSFGPLPPGQYPVTFAEGGLSVGTGWSVLFGSTTQPSTTNEIGFTVTNGSYAFAIATVAGYSESPRTGMVTIEGAPDSVLATFVPIAPGQYPVTFSEAGLPIGTTWSVQLGSTIQPSGSSTDSFVETNGTYGYSLGEVTGFHLAESSGSVLVSGLAVNVPVVFVPVQAGNGSAPTGGGGATTPSGSSGLGGVLLNWVSLGFLGGAVGISALRAIQAAFAAVLLIGIAALVIRWPGRPGRSSSGQNARAIRIGNGQRQGFRPPPS
jgi:hypothetical protein